MNKELLNRMKEYLVSLDKLNSAFPTTKEYLKTKNVNLVSELSDKDKEGLYNYLNGILIANDAIINRKIQYGKKK